MKKTLIIKSKYNHLHKSKKREFTDPVMQGLNRELDEKFQIMQHKLIRDIIKVISNNKLNKSLVMVSGQEATHKYHGKDSSGRYIYHDSQETEYIGHNAPANHKDYDPQKPEFIPRKVLKTDVKRRKLRVKNYTKKQKKSLKKSEPDIVKYLQHHTGLTPIMMEEQHPNFNWNSNFRGKKWNYDIKFPQKRTGSI